MGGLSAYYSSTTWLSWSSPGHRLRGWPKTTLCPFTFPSFWAIFSTPFLQYQYCTAALPLTLLHELTPEGLIGVTAPSNFKLEMNFTALFTPKCASSLLAAGKCSLSLQGAKNHYDRGIPRIASKGSLKPSTEAENICFQGFSSMDSSAKDSIKKHRVKICTNLHRLR